MECKVCGNPVRLLRDSAVATHKDGDVICLASNPTGQKERTNMSWKIIGRHRWIVGAVISESVNDDDSARRYTATVRGYRNWKIFEGELFPGYVQLIFRVVCAIRDRIDEGALCYIGFLVVNRYSHNAAELENKAAVFERSDWIPIEKTFDEFVAGQV